MPNDSVIINDKVQQFIADREMFTSIDISNAIKKDGIWIRNREVADFLRRHDFSIIGYSKTLIPVVTVGGKNTRANCYHPNYADPMHYTKTTQKTLTKKEVDTQHPPVLISNVTNANVNVVPKSYAIVSPLKMLNNKRFRIPKKIVEKVGLYPGYTVDASKIDMTFLKTLSSKLKVTKDGRINIMMSCFKTLNTGNQKIVAYENSGKIYFQ